MGGKQSDPDATPRELAELRLGVAAPPASAGEAERLIHELQVHQIELEMQCEQLQQAQHELLVSQAQYQALYDEAPVGYFTCTTTGRILRANAGMAALLGKSVADLIGASFPSFASPAKRDAFHHHAVELRQAAFASCEMQIVTADDDCRDVRLDSRAERDALGNVIHLNICVADLTDQKRAEAHDLIERSRRDAEQQRINKLESLGQLAGGIAHDFNNLLTGILCNIILAQTEPDPDLAEETLKQAELATRRAAALTGQLLTFAKGGAPIKKATSLAGLIRETAEFALRGSKLKLELALPKDPWLIDGDEGQMSQVFQNLVVNANEAAIRDGRLRIEVKNVELAEGDLPPLPSGKYVRVAVEDRGIGISEADLARVFDPYFTTKERGSGFGLATAFSIARRHGGLITARSRLGEGTTMDVYLPATSGAVSAVVEAPAADPSRRGTGRILVMDDEQSIRALFERVLTRRGYDVDVAADGQKAIDAFRDGQAEGRPYDLVLLDLTVVGGMGGLEALSELRALTSSVCAVVSSGYSEDPVMSEPARHGFCGVLKKPFEPEQLERVVQDALNPGSVD